MLPNFLQSTWKTESAIFKQYLNYIYWCGDINQNILAVLRTFSELLKKFMKNSAPRRQLPKLQLLNFFAKFLTERKSLMKTLTFARGKHLLTKSQNLYSQTNNDGLKAVFYKHFPKELAAVPWMLGTMGVTSRTGIISAIYEKSDKRDIYVYIFNIYNMIYIIYIIYICIYI